MIPAIYKFLEELRILRTMPKQRFYVTDGLSKKKKEKVRLGNMEKSKNVKLKF